MFILINLREPRPIARAHHVLVVFQFPALQALMKPTQVNAIDLDMSELSRMDV